MEKIRVLKINEGVNKYEFIEIDKEKIYEEMSRLLNDKNIDSRLLQINSVCYARFYFHDLVRDFKFYSVYRKLDSETARGYIPNECVCCLFDPELTLKEIYDSENQEDYFVSITNALFEVLKGEGFIQVSKKYNQDFLVVY